MKKILLIEDDTVMRENTAEILGLAHYEVLAAKDGKEGVSFAKEFLPDLIVCDIMMPKLDGYGVLHILSKDPATAGTPFIFLTAKAEKSEMRKGMELGADDYLTKPYEDTELLNAVEIRLKKNEQFRAKISHNIEGIQAFIDQASRVKNLESLAQNRTPVAFKKKATLFHEGTQPQYLYFLSKGKVKAFKAHDDGKEYITDLYKPGDFIGYIPLLQNADYSETAVILEDAEVLKIPKEDFLNLVTQNRDVASQFIKLLAGHIVEKEKQLLSLAYDTVRKKVADALLLLQERYHASNGAKFKMTINRDDLAGLAGTATETVIRMLSEFKDDKLIDVVGREIQILNAAALRNIQ